MDSIYKVFLFNSSGDVNKILIFSGGKGNENENEIFTSVELEEIRQKNITFIWSSLKIYKDDSIKTVKEKINVEWKKTAGKEAGTSPTTPAHLYLFSAINEPIYLEEIYQEITQNEKRPLTKEMFAQLLSNFSIPESQYEKIPPKEFYEYEDFVSAMGTPPFFRQINVPLGFQFDHSPRDHTFVANPFTIINTTATRYSPETAKNQLKINENKVLLSHGNLVGNNLYGCFYEDVTAFSFKNFNDINYIRSLYYPFLDATGATGTAPLPPLEKWKTVDSYHTLFETAQNTPFKMPYISRGIQTIAFKMGAPKTTVIPLESLFKNIHVSATMPFISYNPRIKKEVILRLFTNKIARNGKKIPFLKETEISKISREFNTAKAVAFYLSFSSSTTGATTGATTGPTIDIYMELFQSGEVSIHSTHPTHPLSVEEWNGVFKETLTPLLKNINDILGQSGYSVQGFQDIRQPGMEIQAIKYTESLKIDGKQISLSGGTNGLSEIFTIIGNKAEGGRAEEGEEDMVKGVILRFRRVDNFKENDEQTILITELFKKTNDTEVILSILKDNFQMSDAEATTRLTKFITEHKYELENIQDSAGFPTLFQLNNTNILTITVDEITSFEYLPVLHVYINSILQSNLNPNVLPDALVGKKGWNTKLKKSTMVVNQEIIEQAFNPAGVNKPIMAIQFPQNSEKKKEDGDGDEDEGNEEKEGEDEENENGEDEEDENEEDEEDENEEDEDNDDFINLEEDDEEENDDFIDLEEEGEETNENTKPSSGNLINLEEEKTTKAEEPPMNSGSSSESNGDFINLEETDESNESNASNASNEPATSVKRGGELTDKNLDGQPISFLERLQSREPTLFLSKKDGKYDTYSRMCESNLKRQPVILTDEEKDNIDKNHPGSYSESLKYGTGSDKYWYICPRYWCLKTNTSITAEEVKSGVCGGIIPKGAIKIPRGSYVVEFNSGTKQHLDAKGNYIDNNPGFLSGDSHPNGKCIPCCFKGSWDKPQQKKRRAECSQSSANHETTERAPAPGTEPVTAMGVPAQAQSQAPPPPPTQKVGDVYYIISSLAYPIPLQRFGFLPISIQKLFQMDVSKVISKTNPANIQPNRPCLVRYGVENSNLQSFLSCFAEIYSYKQGLETPPTLMEMKEIMATNITMDNFVNYHNGSLISVFRKKAPVTPEEFQTFSASQLWKMTIEDAQITPNQITEILDIANVVTTTTAPSTTTIPVQIVTKILFLRSAICSYRNFISYIRDPSVAIDHTFLWDAFTDNHPALMKGGVNLIILQIPNEDTTDNVEIICPTLSMSNKSYDFTKETVVLLKQEQFYEPIYLYEEKEKIIRLTKSFMENSPVKPVIQTVQTIKTLTKKYCSAQPSKSGEIYEFKRNLGAKEIVEILKNHDYKTQYQLSNYQGKIIGLYVTPYKELYRPVATATTATTATATGVVIPTFPSSILQPLSPNTPSIPVKFIDENGLYSDYSTTLQRLRNIQRKTENMILAEPKIKVVEDGLVVGIITETNQFVQLSRPITVDATIAVDGANPLKVLSGSNYVIADKTLNTATEGDTERENAIRRISLENQFYLMFRSTIRIFMGKYENRRYVAQIQNIIHEPSLLFKEKLTALIALLKESIGRGNIVKFQEMDEAVLAELERAITNPSHHPDTAKSFCVINDGRCALLLPSVNLVSGYSNEELYYGKMADELVRYSRIRLFMFQPKYFLSIPNQPYSIHNNEFLVLQSLLTHDYFKDATAFNIAPQIQNVDYAFAEPASSTTDIIYSNKITKEELEQEDPHPNGDGGATTRPENQHHCVGAIRPVAGSWKNEFATNPKTKEIVFKNSVICSYSAIIYILQHRVEGGEISVQLVRKILWNGYSKYLKEHEQKIYRILKKQGKVDLIDRVQKGTVSFETVVFSEDYYITDLDYWIISTETQVPIVLFNSTNLKNMVEDINWLFLGGGNIYDPLYFVRSPTLVEKNETPKYSIISPAFKYTELKEMKGKIQGAIEGNPEYARNIVRLLDFLEKGI